MQANPTLVVKNNTEFDQQIDLLSTVASSQGVINENRQYLFNMSCEGFEGTNRVSIETKLNDESVYTTLTAELSDPNVENTVAALNTLNIGTFYSYTDENGDPFITVYSTTRQYRALTLFDQAGRNADVNVGLFISENTTGSVKVYVNCELIEDEDFPITKMETYGLNFGAQVRLVIVGGNNPNPTNYIFYNISSPTGAITSGSVAPGQTLDYEFVITEQSGAFDYEISLTDSV
jgi:hypothetical protein